MPDSLAKNAVAMPGFHALGGGEPVVLRRLCPPSIQLDSGLNVSN